MLNLPTLQSQPVEPKPLGFSRAVLPFLDFIHFFDNTLINGEGISGSIRSRFIQSPQSTRALIQLVSVLAVGELLVNADRYYRIISFGILSITNCKRPIEFVMRWCPTDPSCIVVEWLNQARPIVQTEFISVVRVRALALRTLFHDESRRKDARKNLQITLIA